MDDTSDFCNICGADFRGAAPPVVSEPYPPTPEVTVPVTPAAGRSGDAPGVPVREKSPVPEKPRTSRLRWGLAAVVAVIILVVIAAFLTGMIPGTGSSSDTTPAPPDTTTAPPTQKPAQTAAPAPVPTTAIVPATTVPAPVTANVSVPVTANVSATVTANVSATAAANATANATPALSVIPALQQLSLGQSAWDGKGNLTVNDFTFRDKMSDPIPSYAIGKKYLIVNITYENLQQNGTLDIDLTRLKITDGGGFPYDQASDSVLENVFTGREIQPRQKQTGNLLFIVPPQATFLKLEYAVGTGKTATFPLT